MELPILERVAVLRQEMECVVCTAGHRLSTVLLPGQYGMRPWGQEVALQVPLALHVDGSTTELFVQNWA